jgi:hypothetical protein
MVMMMMMMMMMMMPSFLHLLLCTCPRRALSQRGVSRLVSGLLTDAKCVILQQQQQDLVPL